ncbi:MAG: hypothetical protein IPG64_20360 [Haliea sp.]|nr:hypothetical protein [Haliea sp.]
MEVAVLSQPGDAPALDIADWPFRLESGNQAAIDGFIARCDIVTLIKKQYLRIGCRNWRGLSVRVASVCFQR